MPNGRIFRPIQTDADHIDHIRKVVEEARELLKASPDTFLGRKTHEPFTDEKKAD